MKSFRILILFFLSLLYLQGCAAIHSTKDTSIRGKGIAVDVEYVEQQEHYSCGAASLEMVSSYWGKRISQEDLISSATEDIKREGYTVADLKQAAIRYGLKAVSLAGSTKLLQQQIAKGRPVIVALNLPYNRTVRSPLLRKFPASKGAAFFMDGYSHYVTVVGMTDLEIIVMDPLTGIDTYSYQDFIEYWRGQARAVLLISS